MSRKNLRPFLDGGEQLFAALERETLSCLNNFESLPGSEIEAFIARRQDIIQAIQNFDSDFRKYNEMEKLKENLPVIDKFNQLHSALLRRVIEVDGLLIALAEREMSKIKKKLSNLSAGKVALQGYKEDYSAANIMQRRA